VAATETETERRLRLNSIAQKKRDKQAAETDIERQFRLNLLAQKKETNRAKLAATGMTETDIEHQFTPDYLAQRKKGKRDHIASASMVETDIERRVRLDYLAQKKKMQRDEIAATTAETNIERRVRLDYLAQQRRSLRAAARTSGPKTLSFQQPGAATQNQHVSTTCETSTETQIVFISLQQTELLALQTNMNANGTHLYLPHLLHKNTFIFTIYT